MNCGSCAPPPGTRRHWPSPWPGTPVIDHAYHARLREASQLASEAMALLESIGDPNLTVGLCVPVLYAKLESAEYSEVLRWTQRVIDLADGDPSKGDFIFGSPLYLAFSTRGIARYGLGSAGWRDDLRHGLAMARSTDPLSYAGAVSFVYFAGIPFGVLTPDDSVVREIEEALRIAERSGDDLAVTNVRMALGIGLVHRDTAAERDRGQQLLAEVAEVFVRRGHNLADLPIVNVYLAASGLGGEIAMRPYRSCAPPSTICSARDGCCCGALLRRVFWSRRCWTMGPKVTWPKPRPRSTGWRRHQPKKDW